MAYRLEPATFANTARVFEGIHPWQGFAPRTRLRNLFGTVRPVENSTDGQPQTDCDETDFEEIEPISCALPEPSGESYFEFYSLVSSVREAHDRYVAVSLGAHFGEPLVNAARALTHLNAMPYRLIGVEGDRHMVAMLKRHFVDNGIEPRDHCIINAVVSDTNTPVVFPTSDVRTGANSAFHEPAQRESLYDAIAKAGLSDAVLQNVVTTGSTGLQVPLWEGSDAKGELEFVSALTLTDILGLAGETDYLEIDIQGSETRALPPAADALNRKVKWLHLGTHGKAVHEYMRELIESWGWRTLVDLLPESTYRAPDREFETQDGILIARNPRLPFTAWSDLPVLEAA